MNYTLMLAPTLITRSVAVGLVSYSHHSFIFFLLGILPFGTACVPWGSEQIGPD